MKTTMKSMKYVAIGLLFIGMTALIGCKKEVVGPQGPKGDQGDVSNSVKTATFVVNSSDWQGSSTYWWYESAPLNLDFSGIVMVYRGSGTFYEALSTSNANNNNEAIGFDYDTDLKIVGITHASISGAAIPQPGTETFKVVVIPTSGIKANPNLDLKDYKSVAKAFDLE